MTLRGNALESSRISGLIVAEFRNTGLLRGVVDFAPDFAVMGLEGFQVEGAVALGAC